MKLSDAIMLGSMTGPQIRGHLIDGDGSCAIGAAYKAEGVSLAWDNMPVAAIWSWLDRPCKCPVCNQEMTKVTYVITNHLNDTHEWTREQIAEWVATIEPADITAPEVAEEAACTTQK